MKQQPYKILLLDDDRFLLDMYQLKFTERGHTVVSCLSSKDALSKLREGLVLDGLVVDLIMPDMDGKAFLEAVSKEGLAKGAAVIILSNQAQESEASDLTSLGVDDFILKASAVPSEVLAEVEEVVAKKKGSKT